MNQKLNATLAENIRLYIVSKGFQHNERLPPERELAAHFKVSRGELRKALNCLEADGLIWRHVGRGTFVGARPVLNLNDVAYLGELASPIQVIAARLAIEPSLARLAAHSGTRADFIAMRTCNERCRAAPDWRSYEAQDNNLHAIIAKATQNKLLVYLFETLNVVRRSTVWGQSRETTGPAASYCSFDEHEAICAAIEARDADLAEACMREHLISVRDRVLPTLSR
ncbi:FadR/GntR family transcriptional regulator [Pacificibacter marinus]|uniref:FadR/GntR family transcriptional regulator n=1 Tax=Pacificibacter marinus TaxID=658057 RepID=UPI001C0652A9|nr:FadR/GntR family transcriptional regulator [Pacificibacter marinus]MBU2868088.1 FadR family transcriptional regulator [Pacificibacter marinus]